MKTSIYVDKELWSSFKEYSRKNGFEVSEKLEQLIEDSLIEKNLDRALSESEGGYETDFEPVKPKGGPISSLVRVARDERSNSLLGQQRNSKKVRRRTRQ